MAVPGSKTYNYIVMIVIITITLINKFIFIKKFTREARKAVVRLSLRPRRAQRCALLVGARIRAPRRSPTYGSFIRGLPRISKENRTKKRNKRILFSFLKKQNLESFPFSKTKTHLTEERVYGKDETSFVFPRATLRFARKFLG